METMHATGRRVAGFTMVELVMVTAVVTVMASLLLPAVVTAREKAAYGRWLAQKSQARADDGLIAYWDFEAPENSDLLVNQALGLDVPGYEPQNMDGRVVHATFSSSDGRWPGKGALRFAAANSHVYTEAATGIDGAQGSVLVWARARPGAAQGHDTLLFDCSTSGGTSLISLTALYGEFGFSIGDVAFGGTGRRFDDGLWHQCVLTWEAGAYTVYWDGAPVADGSYGGMTGMSTVYGLGRMHGIDLSTGADLLGSTSWDGWIDEAAVYRRALTAREVADLYRNGQD